MAGRPSFSSSASGPSAAGPACRRRAPEPDGAPGVGDAAGDRLTDPPRGVRRELEALAPVELLDGVHEAEVASPGSGRAAAGPTPGTSWRSTPPGAGSTARTSAGPRRRSRAPANSACFAAVSALPGAQDRCEAVALFDRLGQADFVAWVSSGYCPDVVEVEPDQIFFGPLICLFSPPINPLRLTMTRELLRNVTKEPRQARCAPPCSVR